MNEYSDQDVWFELYGDDGFGGEFIADFSTRAEAEDYAETSDVMAVYGNYRIVRRRGVAA